MADYYPLIARAVSGLDKSTGEARRALYERARTALVTQLRGVEPTLSEADIRRERLALEEAIRKVEGEAARRPRQESEAPANAAPPLARFEKPSSCAPPPPSSPEADSDETFPPPPPPDWDELRRELDGLAPPQSDTDDILEPERDPLAPSPYASGMNEQLPPFRAESLQESEPVFPEPVPPPAPREELPVPPRRFDRKPPAERKSLVDEGLKGFRDVMAETDDLGGATASASKSARETREAFSALPPSSDAERIEPRMPPRFGLEDIKQSQQAARQSPSARGEARAGGRARPTPPPPLQTEEFEEPKQQRLRSGGIFPKVVALVAVLILAGAAFFAYREWGSNITGMFQSAKAPVTQASRDAPQARPKISDRIGGAQDTSSRPAGGNATAVAQRAVLYEQGATVQERKEYVGSVIWRTETSSPGPGQPPDVAVKAEVEIPERHIRMGLTIRRNLDQSLPASHTIEVIFSTPADFQPGGISDMGGVLMEDAEQSRGVPLAGMQVKVTNGFFLVGLSSVEGDLRRNLQLLKDRAWMHIRIAYNNGQRALLTLEKGVPGDRVLEEALTAWGQMPTSAQQR